MRIRYWSADVCSSDLLCVRGLIGNNKRLSRSCKQDNANPAKELPFGFGYERVAWTHDHIDRAYDFCSDRQGSDSLHTAQAVDPVSPGTVLRSNARGSRAPLIGRRPCGDPTDESNRVVSD